MDFRCCPATPARKGPPASFDVKEIFLRTALEVSTSLPFLGGDLLSICLSYVSWSFRFSEEIADKTCSLREGGKVATKLDQASASCGVLGTPRIGPGVIAFWKIAVDCSLDEMWIGVVDKKELAIRSVRDRLWHEKTRHYDGMWAYCDGSRTGSSSFGCGPTVFPAYHDTGDYHTGDVISIYVDFDRKLMKVAKNGSWQCECTNLVSDTGEFIPYVELAEEGDQVTLWESALTYRHRGALAIGNLNRLLRDHMSSRRRNK
uniref:B30.2/SPRY domain-containing protein n=1 Tax=Lotharella oceanica TaxID=641309 RepID=A0A7S2X937_9EUKA|mmetsp:Transcript_19286/g.36294  ORF Transcript_19286/g.36294 Transcript_19286/m.36294 type:complete len:260 (+) Transcript_19286:88-867(+)